MSSYKTRRFQIGFRNWIITGGLIFSPFLMAAPEHASLPYMQASDFTPFWRNELSEKDAAPATVTPFQFKNQSRQKITEANMKGHISLVNFFFTSCGMICPRLMTQVQGVQKKLNSHKGVKFYSISVTPDQDSPEILTEYAKSRHIQLNNWDLVTGDRTAIYKLGREIFRADRNPDGTLSKSDFIHSQSIYLLDALLRIRGVYQSVKVEEMNALIEDVATLEKE